MLFIVHFIPFYTVIEDGTFVRSMRGKGHNGTEISFPEKTQTGMGLTGSIEGRSVG